MTGASVAVNILVRLVGIPGPSTAIVSQNGPPAAGQGVAGNLVFDTSATPAGVWLNIGGAWTQLGSLDGNEFGAFSIAGSPLLINGSPLGIS